MSSNTRPKLTLGARTSANQHRSTRQGSAPAAPKGDNLVQEIMQNVSGTLQLDDAQMESAEAFARRLLS